VDGGPSRWDLLQGLLFLGIIAVLAILGAPTGIHVVEWARRGLAAVFESPASVIRGLFYALVPAWVFGRRALQWLDRSPHLGGVDRPAEQGAAPRPATTPSPTQEERRTHLEMLSELDDDQLATLTRIAAELGLLPSSEDDEIAADLDRDEEARLSHGLPSKDGVHHPFDETATTLLEREEKFPEEVRLARARARGLNIAASVAVGVVSAVSLTVASQGSLEQLLTSAGVIAATVLVGGDLVGRGFARTVFAPWHRGCRRGPAQSSTASRTTTR